MRDNMMGVNVSVIILGNDNTFLLIKRAADEEVFPGYWGIPGGTVEKDDERLEAALERECMEEVGIEITDLKPLTNDIVVRGEKCVLYVVYTAKLYRGEPMAKDGTELVAWKDIDEALSLQLTPKTGDLLLKANKERR